MDNSENPFFIVLRLKYANPNTESIVVDTVWNGRIDCSFMQTNYPKVSELVFSKKGGITHLENLPPSLKKLECTNQLLTAVPDHLENIAHLNLANNQIESIEPIKKMGMITVLHLEGNQIQGNVSNLPDTLNELYLSGNPITVVDFTNLSRITVLKTDSNIHTDTVSSNVFRFPPNAGDDGLTSTRNINGGGDWDSNSDNNSIQNSNQSNTSSKNSIQSNSPNDSVIETPDTGVRNVNIGDITSTTDLTTKPRIHRAIELYYNYKQRQQTSKSCVRCGSTGHKLQFSTEMKQGSRIIHAICPRTQISLEMGHSQHLTKAVQKETFIQMARRKQLAQHGLDKTFEYITNKESIPAYISNPVNMVAAKELRDAYIYSNAEKAEHVRKRANTIHGQMRTIHETKDNSAAEEYSDELYKQILQLGKLRPLQKEVVELPGGVREVEHRITTHDDMHIYGKGPWTTSYMGQYTASPFTLQVGRIPEVLEWSFQS